MSVSQSVYDQIMAAKGTMSLKEAGRKFGVSKTSVTRYWNGERVVRGDTRPVKQSNVPVANGCIMMNDILKEFDHTGKLANLVTSIPRGMLRTDEDLRKTLGLGDERWRRVSGSARLAGHWLNLPDRSRVWGSKSTIAEVAKRLQEL